MDVDADEARTDRSLARFGMGRIDLVIRGLSSEGQRESSRAAWPLVRFTFAAATDELSPLARL